MRSSARPTSAVSRADTRTLSQRVADRLRDLIITGDLHGGRSLRQAELAEQLGVSPIPLREALRQLEAEGFVTTLPYRGAVVAPLTGAEAREIAEVCTALDSLALRLAVPKLTAVQIRRAEALLQQLDARPGPRQWLRLEEELWATLFAAAERPLLQATITRLHRYAARYVASPGSAQRRRPPIGLLHDVLAACRRRDVAAAVGVIERYNARYSPEDARVPRRRARRRA